jgi:hypothetical protein
VSQHEIFQPLKITVKEVENKIAYYKETVGVLEPNILARKSEEGPLPYCKTRNESESNN